LGLFSPDDQAGGLSGLFEPTVTRLRKAIPRLPRALSARTPAMILYTPMLDAREWPPNDCLVGEVWTVYEDAVATAFTFAAVLFFAGAWRLPFFAATNHAGGLPRRAPLLRASLSRLMIASSTWSRSFRNSTMIFVTSM
jgi:hypothetical protein